MNDLNACTLPENIQDITNIQYADGSGGPFPFMKCVTITQLEIDPVNKDDMNNTMDYVLFGRVLRYKKSSNKEKDFFKGTKKTTMTASYAYDRMMMIQDLSAQPGTNVFAILMSSTRNSHLWDAFLHDRDTGGFEPGQLIAIESPKHITSHMGKDENLPILEVPNCILRVKHESIPNFTVPIVPNSNRLHAFQSVKATVHITNVTLIDGICKGNFCGGLEQMKDGQRTSYCPCYTALNGKRRMVLLVDMMVILKDVEEDTPVKKLKVFNFTSHKFTKLFCKNSDIPLGVTEAMVNQNRQFKYYIMSQVIKGVEKVNSTVGWSLAGWVRRGYTKDEGMNNAAAAGGNGMRLPPSERIQTADLTHHVTWIVVNKIEGASVDLSEFKIDFAGMLKKRSVDPENPRPQQQRRVDNGKLSSSKVPAPTADSTAASGIESD